MIRAAYLLGLAQATTTVSNLVCNGFDNLKFSVAKDAAFGTGTVFKFFDCDLADMNKVHDLTPTQVPGTTDEWEISFNPYSQCKGAVTNTNSASSYDVNMKVVMIYQSQIAGVSVFAGAEEVQLTCTFLDEYSAEFELGQMSIVADPIDPQSFDIDFSLSRYTEQGGNTEADPSQAVVSFQDLHIRAEGDADFQKTMFSLSITKVTFQKASPAPQRDMVLFDASDASIPNLSSNAEFANAVRSYYGSDRMKALDFRLWAMQDTNGDRIKSVMGFSHKSFFLDSDVDATYKVIVKAVACTVGSTSKNCNVASQAASLPDCFCNNGSSASPCDATKPKLQCVACDNLHFLSLEECKPNPVHAILGTGTSGQLCKRVEIPNPDSNGDIHIYNYCFDYRRSGANQQNLVYEMTQTLSSRQPNVVENLGGIAANWLSGVQLELTFGSNCNGTKRRSTVWFNCGPTLEITSVTEPNSCVYDVRIQRVC